MLHNLLKAPKGNSNSFQVVFLTERLLFSTCPFSESHYSSLVERSLTETHLHQIYVHLLSRKLHLRHSLFTKLLKKSFSLASFTYARKLFDAFPLPNLFLYNSLIKCYTIQRLVPDAIQVYSQMHALRFAPDAFTFPCLLKCSPLPVGRCIHAHVFRYGFHSDLFVQNGVLSLYTGCSEISKAENVFANLFTKSVVSWTLMINAYSRTDRPLEALKLFSEMRTTVEADSIALVSVLKALSDVQDAVNSKAIHCLSMKLGFDNDADLNISFTSSYSKEGNLKAARIFFERMETREVTAWNAMISGYANNGCSQEAIALVRAMIKTKIEPDSITLTSCCLACAQEGSIHAATWMDHIVAQSRYSNDVVVNTSLIDMYAKCGDLGSARSVFDRVEPKDTVLWSAMIVGYGLHGLWKESVDLFEEMDRAGVESNGVTFLGLLTACKNSGRVKEGWGFFNRMVEFGVEPNQQHYACVVDLMARGGHLERAWEVVESMKVEASASVWGALLSGCEIHGHVALAEYAAGKLFALDCRSAGRYVQLSNLYASSHLWDNVSDLRNQMKRISLPKDFGHSVVHNHH